jgi:hypothetical protein
VVERPHGTDDVSHAGPPDGAGVSERPETLFGRAPDGAAGDVGVRARERHAAREPDVPDDAEPVVPVGEGDVGDPAPPAEPVAVVEPVAADPAPATQPVAPVAEPDPGDPVTPTQPHAGNGDLIARADDVRARFGHGEIDELAHDAELQRLVRQADATVGDPAQVMDVADRIRDAERREWTQSSVLGRYAEAHGYSTEELAQFAAELETEVGIDGFMSGLAPDTQTEVRAAMLGQTDAPDAGVRSAGDADLAGPFALERTAGNGDGGTRLGPPVRWPVPDEAEWTTADRELFREAATVDREREHGLITDVTADARLQQLAQRAEPTRAGWEISDRIDDPVARAETRADLAGAVARAGDRTTAWAMAEAIDPYVADTQGRQIRSHALAEVAEASETREAAYALVDHIEDPGTQREVREILGEAERRAEVW